MNKEDIILMAREADKWSQTITWSSDPKYGGRPVSDLFNEKFAELVAAHILSELEYLPGRQPVQVPVAEFVEMVLEKEHLVGKPLVWAQWPNEEQK